MPPENTPPRDSYIILVSGAMNPLVHTPQFYRTIGVMDEAELQASLRMPLSGTTPALSQFQFGTPQITVACQPSQWWIQSADGASWDHMLGIVSLVFSKLGGTPVSGYTLASQRHIPTDTDVKVAIQKRIAGLNMGFPSGVSLGSSLELAVSEEDYTIAAVLQPSVLSERAVYALYQREYQIPASPVGGLIQVTPLIKARLEKFVIGSEQYFRTAVDAINAVDEKG